MLRVFFHLCVAAKPTSMSKTFIVTEMHSSQFKVFAIFVHYFFMCVVSTSHFSQSSHCFGPPPWWSGYRFNFQLQILKKNKNCATSCQNAHLLLLLLSVALYGESRRGREQYFASPWAKPSCSFHHEVMNYYTSYLFSIHVCLPNVIEQHLKSQTQLFMSLFSYHRPVLRVNHIAPHTSNSYDC